jgi:hypothetical protein
MEYSERTIQNIPNIKKIIFIIGAEYSV